MKWYASSRSIEPRTAPRATWARYFTHSTHSATFRALKRDGT
jgi:hypothetical protein